MRLLRLLVVLLAASVTIFVLNFNFAAACIELKAAKAIYFPGETAQIEIEAATTRVMSSQDVSVYRDTAKLPTAIFISQITKTKYFAWFDFPLEPGAYVVRVRGYCPELKVVELSIEVKETAATRHLALKEKVKEKWKTLPLETHILAAGALSYDEIVSQAFSDYLKRSDSCANAYCSTKEAALTLAAFESALLKEKMFKLLDAYQNCLDGEWQLQISSEAAQKCTLDITAANITQTLEIAKGTNFVNLTAILTNATAASVVVKLSCESNATESNVTANLFFSKNGFDKSFELAKENNKLKVKLDSSGCWGNGFKTECNSSATAYALVALAKSKNLNLSNFSSHAKALGWLRTNAKTTEEKAALYYITRDKELLDELIGAQSADGFWFDELYRPDVRGTVIAAFALKSSNETSALNAAAKATSWLRAQKFIVSDEAFSLFFAFPEVEPVIAIWPGMIKTTSQATFNLMLTNKGNIDVKLVASFLNSSTAAELKRGEMKNVRFKMPIAMTLDGRTLLSSLVLDYNSAISDIHYFYNIPLLIFTEKGNREQIGQLTVTEQEINQTEQQAIINETISSPLENKTSELNVSLLQERFKFAEKTATTKINRTETKRLSLTLENGLDKKVQHIELSPNTALQQGNLVRVEPSNISAIEAGGRANITVYINPFAVEAGIYQGYLQASASYETTKITTYIPLTIEVIAAVELLSCAELNGTVCDVDGMTCYGETKQATDTDNCCVPADGCKKKPPAGRALGLIIVAVVVAMLIVILLLLRTKPKKEMKAFLEEKAKEFEMKKIRRPLTLTRAI